MIPADTSVFVDGVFLIIVIVTVTIFWKFSLAVLKDKHLGWWEN